MWNMCTTIAICCSEVPPVAFCCNRSYRRNSPTASSAKRECARIIVRGNNWGRGKKLTLSGPADALGRALRLVNRYGREAAREAEGDPLPQIGEQVADTARPLAAGPDPSFTPGETSVLRAIAAELESAGHNVRGFGAWVLDGGGISSLPREILKQAQQLFDLAIRLHDLALAREYRDVAIYQEGFALGSSSSS